MFAKFRSTRTPAATTSVPAPQFEAGPPSQSASKTSPSLVKKFLRVKNVFRRSSSTQKDADHQGTPSRQQGVPTPSQPSQGASALNYDDRAAFHRRPYLHPSVEPTQSPSSLNASPRFQAGWQSSNSSAAHRTNLSASASPLLAPPQSVAATPVTSFAPTGSSSDCSTRSAAPRRIISLNPSPLAPPASVTTTIWNDAGTIDRQNAPHHTASRQQGLSTPSRAFQGPSALTHDDRHQRPYLHPSVEPTQSSRLRNQPHPFQAGCQSSTSAAHRSNISTTASSLLAAPESVSARPAAASAPIRSPANCSTKSGVPRLISTSLNASSQLAPPASVATTVQNDAGTIARRDAHRQGTPSRRQGVTTPARPSQVPSALKDLSPPFQTRWQSSNSSAAYRSNLSASVSPLLAPLQSVAAAAPATSFAPAPSTPTCSTQSAAPRITTSLNASSPLASPAFVATTPATSSTPPRSSFQSSARPVTSRSTYSPKISSPLAPPRSVATTPSTTFSSTRRPSRRSAVFTAPGSTSSFDASPLLAPLQLVATTPATERSPAFSSFDCSKSSDSSSPHQLIAELEETVAHLHSQYNAARRSAHTMIQWHVFPYAKSLADEAKKAKEELEEVRKKIAGVDTDCSELEALLRGEHEKLEEVEEALKKAYWHREGINEEHALLLDDVHELQAGQPVNGVWQQRAGEPLQQNSTPSQSVANPERVTSLATLESSQRVKSWDSQWESMIERQRYSLPRPVQVTTSKSNETESRTNNMRLHDARPADTSDYFGTPLRWGQLAQVSSVHPPKETTRPGKQA